MQLRFVFLAPSLAVLAAQIFLTMYVIRPSCSYPSKYLFIVFEGTGKFNAYDGYELNCEANMATDLDDIFGQPGEDSAQSLSSVFFGRF